MQRSKRTNINRKLVFISGVGRKEQRRKEKRREIVIKKLLFFLPLLVEMPDIRGSIAGKCVNENVVTSKPDATVVPITLH